MTEKEKAKAYDEAIERAKKLYGNGITEEIFPELKENDTERIRKNCIHFLELQKQHHAATFGIEECIDWLEEQGKKSSWKPSKEEMDVLYSLSYITNEYDEHKEDVITHLYQDLKREFFNDSSYENMFSLDNKEDEVRLRSTIQVLEYARSLDAYNQYGKADIDKNIAWLEKQGKNSTDKIEPRFKVGDWITFYGGNPFKILNIEAEMNGVLDYLLLGQNGYDSYFNKTHIDENARLWTIQDAKDGDVLACNEEILLFKSYSVQGRISLYCWYNGHTNNFHSKEVIDILLTTTNKVCPATKEQRDALMRAINNTGYKWDAEKKELKKNVRVQ